MLNSWLRVVSTECLCARDCVSKGKTSLARFDVLMVMLSKSLVFFVLSHHSIIRTLSVFLSICIDVVQLPVLLDHLAQHFVSVHLR